MESFRQDGKGEAGDLLDCSCPVTLSWTETRSVDVRPLVEFFLLLDKWDTLQSMHKQGESRPCSEDTAA